MQAVSFGSGSKVTAGNVCITNSIQLETALKEVKNSTLLCNTIYSGHFEHQALPQKHYREIKTLLPAETWTKGPSVGVMLEIQLGAPAFGPFVFYQNGLKKGGSNALLGRQQISRLQSAYLDHRSLSLTV